MPQQNGERAIGRWIVENGWAVVRNLVTVILALLGYAYYFGQNASAVQVRDARIDQKIEVIERWIVSHESRTTPLMEDYVRTKAQLEERLAAMQRTLDKIERRTR
jgi:predicted negative regulator of RcsB-dependent stress response